MLLASGLDMKILYVFIVALYLSGCALFTPPAESRGNAVYDVACPVLLPNGTAATYTNEDGKVLPVLAEFTANSGRNLGGGANIDIPNCIKIDIPKLEQGEDRSGSITEIGRDVIRSVLGLLIPL